MATIQGANPPQNPGSQVPVFNGGLAGANPPTRPGGPYPVNFPGGGGNFGNTGGAGNVNVVNSDPYQNLLKQLQGLNGSERDAYAALDTLFTSYGLASLAPKILDFLQQGFGSDTITVLLQQTPEYKARFKGNDARVANGLQVLTPAEYLSTEASYRQLLQASGLDPAFMNEGQYAEWIGKDISPTEIQDRVNLAIQATTQADAGVTQGFAQLGIHAGDLASYFLNDKNAMPQMQLKLNQAQIIGAGLDTGVQTNTADALKFAQQGVTYQQAQNAYQRVAEVLPTANQLTQIYKNQNPYGQQQAEQEFVGSNGQASYAREQLGLQEEATFSGAGGVGQKSFAQQNAGTGF